jgi:monoamine oxidase
VVGAFAGIAAAREASSLGCSVLLVEGLDRLGGRTWTTNALGTQVEMGGTDVREVP